MSEATEKLLTELHWPKSSMADKGRVSWTRAGGDSSVDAAMLLVSPTEIRARLMKMWPDGPDPMHFEAIWSIGASQDPDLTSYAYGGERQPLDQAAAISRFSEMLEILNARPAFQTMGTRWKRSSAVPTATRM